MDSIVGICGHEFVLIAADSNVLEHDIKLVRNKDKLTEIDGDKIIAASGNLADCGSFPEFVKRNAHLERLKNRGRALTPSALANFARTELSIALRKTPYQVNSLIGGFNKTTNKAELFWLDFFGTLNPTKIAAQGQGASLIMSILDQVDVNNLTEDSASMLLNKCIAQLRDRFKLSQSSFIAKRITKNGIELVDLDSVGFFF